MTKKKSEIAIHSSAAEYLKYVASIGDRQDSMEMRYKDENMIDIYTGTTVLHLTRGRLFRYMHFLS